MKIEQCVYAGDRERTEKLRQREPSLRWARDKSIYEFCDGCEGYNERCQFYYKGNGGSGE